MVPDSILGIDPAPKNSSTVFDGESYQKFTPVGLKKRLEEERDQNQSTLICWDAPLIRMSDKEIDDKGGDLKGFDGLYNRPIDNFLRKSYFSQNKQNSQGKGVSVMAYAGCPHWTITKYCLGLPQVGDLDQSELPYELVTYENEEAKQFHRLVEVHPAVALFFWAGRSLPKYKKDPEQVALIWDRLLRGPDRDLFRSYQAPKDDDELDALAAYVLGRTWYKEPDRVQLLGDSEKGGLLVPSHKDIMEKYQQFPWP